MDSSFPELFRRRALRDPERRALTFGGRSWTYAELRRSFETLAGRLHELGLRRGDRLLYAGLNHPSLVHAMFAAMDLGAVFVPVDPRLASPERAWVMEDIRPQVVVVADEFREAFAAAAPGQTTVLSADGPGQGGIAGLIESGGAPARSPVARTDLALILYTSGTTGRAKGVLHTHEMILANGLNLARLLGTRRDDVGLVMTPMFHTAGINTSPVNLWAYGGEVVLLPRMDGPAALDAIVRHRVTRIDTVTAALHVLFHTPGFGDADLAAIRSLNVGGAAIPAEQVASFRKHGAEVFMAVGMTECCVAAALAPERIDAKPASVGTPLSLVDARLVDIESGREVTGPGVPGELRLRGPSVSQGYWNNPQATAAAFDSEGWYRTGDIARMDEDGDLYLVGRVKDVIKTGGESVAAAEVERVIAEHPAVSVCAVVGAPDERWGETIVAVVSVRAGRTLGLEELRAFCADRLARFKLPTGLVVTDDIPMTASGKIAKGRIRERIAASPPPAG
ncbi:class I adenylate-forming enzyme family protein [Streptomyces gilvus]|uniref:class I adenylate-forming enzyme family protein n=1 Tax=Streptomyces gilvus TaxID=2920937 RepID=UPI001F0D1633|nr:AMP-binding protein [Streptomyces sp. CME 23]MCH5677589.1 AMP-binding protein [Streptomyces sp. CME 23]